MVRKSRFKQEDASARKPSGDLPNRLQDYETIGFATIFMTLGAITIVLTVVGGRKFLEKPEYTIRREMVEKQDYYTQ
jgi:hypothetical protein